MVANADSEPVKTVEAHRSKVFAKMEVATSAELIRLVMSEGAAVAQRKPD